MTFSKTCVIMIKAIKKHPTLVCVCTHTQEHREQKLQFLSDFYECVFVLFTYVPKLTAHIYSSILNTFCQELFGKCPKFWTALSLFLSGVIAYN